MPSFKNILFPLNGNPDSMDYAIMMAKKSQAKLYILKTLRFKDLQSIKDHRPTDVKTSMKDSIMKEFDEVYKHKLEESNLDYEFSIEIGFLTDRISESIKDHGIDILLINKLDEHSDDNIIEKLNQLKIPVMLIPKKQEPNPSE
jgi:hypothetical protein